MAGRRCTVCIHLDRSAIDTAIVNHRPFRRIAAQFSLSLNAVIRHHEQHIPEVLARAKDEADIRHAIDIAQQLRAANSVAWEVLQQARGSGNGELALRAVDRLQRQIELVAKIAGDLDERPVVNVLLSDEWIAVRTAVLRALEPHPEARLAVVTSLKALA